MQYRIDSGRSRPALLPEISEPWQARSRSPELERKNRRVQDHARHEGFKEAVLALPHAGDRSPALPLKRAMI